MIADLKPCPCCGYFPEHEREHYTEECGCVSTVHRVHCRNCGLATPRGPAETLRWWNTRLTEDALRAENQRLREALAPFAEREEQARVGDDGIATLVETD